MRICKPHPGARGHIRTRSLAGKQARPGLFALRCHEFFEQGNIVTMARIVVVTSGKGGVSKTRCSENFSADLGMHVHKTVVIDFYVVLRNLNLIMGCDRRVVYDFVNVIQGEATLNQALIRDKQLENLKILPASQTRDKDALTRD